MPVTKTKKNILFISHVSSKKFGGAERVLDDIVSNIDHEKYRTILLLQQKTGTEKLDWDCSANTDIEFFDFGLLSHRFKIIGLIGMLFRVVKGFFYIKRLIKKHDIDVICANTLIAAAFSVMPSRYMRKQFFYYEHNIVEHRKGHLIGLALYPVSKLSTNIICISESVKQSLAREGVCLSKLHLVYNGADFKGLDYSLSTGNGLPARYQDNVLRVGMVANFMPWKRHQLFLELMSGLSDKVPGIRIEAVIVGGCLPGNEGYYQEIVSWVNNYKGSVVYTLTGFQDNVAEYFRSFDILINPAKAEPFGLIFLEAMYLGCVVVGSNQGAAPEIINDGATGCIVDYDDIDSVLIRLAHLALNKKDRINMGERASEVVKKDFSIENQIQQLEKLFDNVA